MTNRNTCDLNDINIIFTTIEKGRELISQRDSHIKRLTQMDLDCRCHKRGATLAEYQTLCKESVLEFSEAEQEKVKFLLCEIDSELKRRGMELPFLETIHLVKTTAEEENYAYGYTRGNTIYINQHALGSDGVLERILVHGLCHILTHNHPAFRKTMYRILGFKLEDRLFRFSETAHFHIENILDEALAEYFAIAVLGTLMKVPNPGIVKSIRMAMQQLPAS